MTTSQKVFKKKIIMSILVLAGIIGILSTVAAVRTFAQHNEADPQEAAVVEAPITPEQADVSKFALISAAIAFGFGAIGAGIAIGNVGAAAMGAIAEKPEVAGQALIFVALAEGLVVFGFITALMLLGKA